MLNSILLTSSTKSNLGDYFDGIICCPSHMAQTFTESVKLCQYLE